MILNDANIKILIIVAAKTEFEVNSHHFSGLVLIFLVPLIQDLSTIKVNKLNKVVV